jgi:hypothetical protein
MMRERSTSRGYIDNHPEHPAIIPQATRDASGSLAKTLAWLASAELLSSLNFDAWYVSR